MTIDLDDLRPILDDAGTVHVGIRTSSGPHVTPELFTVSGGRILCLTSVMTLKSRLTRDDPIAAVCAWGGGSSTSVLGAVELIDPAAPATVLGSPMTAARSPLGVARFLRDNIAEMAGAAVDLMAGRLGGPIPPHRVILAITPVAAVIETDGVATLSDGWDLDPGPVPAPESDGSPPAAIDLTELPGALDALVAPGPAALGWARTDGAPLVLPAMWDPAAGCATVARTVFDACGARTEGAGCITFDAWTGFGPSGKQGVMLRGEGSASGDGDIACVRLEVTRASYWDGIETGTVDVTTTHV